MAATTDIGLPKLRGVANFSLWKTATRIEMKKRKLWGYMSGYIPKPAEPAHDDVFRLDSDEFLPAAWKLSRWTEKSNEAMKLIMSTVPLWMINTLSAEQRETSKALWDALCERYGRQADYRIFMRWKWMDWDGSTDMSTFLGEWTAALADCVDENLPISKLNQASMLAYAVKGHGSKKVDTWAAEVSKDCSEKTVKPLHDLLEELVEICEEEKKVEAEHRTETKSSQ